MQVSAQYSALTCVALNSALTCVQCAEQCTDMRAVLVAAVVVAAAAAVAAASQGEKRRLRMASVFDEHVERRGTRCAKWDSFDRTLI